jgi:hypothetical protein
VTVDERSFPSATIPAQVETAVRADTNTAPATPAR